MFARQKNTIISNIGWGIGLNLFLTLPLPIFVYEYHTDNDFAKNTDIDTKITV